VKDGKAFLSSAHKSKKKLPLVTSSQLKHLVNAFKKKFLIMVKIEASGEVNLMLLVAYNTKRRTLVACNTKCRPLAVSNTKCRPLAVCNTKCRPLAVCNREEHMENLVEEFTELFTKP